LHILAGLFEHRALGRDHCHELVPGFDEGSCPVFLKFGGQSVEVDSCAGKARQAFNLEKEAPALRDRYGRTTVGQIEAGIVQEIGVRKLIRILEYLGLELGVRPEAAPPTLDELRKRGE